MKNIPRWIHVLSLVLQTHDNIYRYLYDKYLELLDVRKVLLTLVWNDQHSNNIYTSMLLNR